MIDELETQIRDSLRRSSLPAAPDHLRERVAKSLASVRADEAEVRDRGRIPRRRPWLLLPAAAILIALAGLSVLIPGSPPPTVVDGLPVLSVSELLAQRALGGLRNQPVALGGYWSDDFVGHSCAAAERHALEMGCHDDEYGITEMNEPMLRFGRFTEIMYRVQGPSITPYLPQDLVGLDGLYRYEPDGDHFPPTPIVVVGHFDDPLAQGCRPDLRQSCLDRLVVERIVYFNPGAANWAPNIPTREPTDPPAPSHY